MNNNISFQGRSSLQFDSNLYRKISELSTKKIGKIRANSNISLLNSKFYTINPDSTNLAVIIRNERNGLAKLVSVKGDIEEKLFEIGLGLERLKESAKGKLTAWIVGGDKFSGENGTNTITTLNKFADLLCDRPDIDTSLLVGIKHNTKQENIILHTLNDFLEMTLDKPKGSILDDAFDIVEINNTKFI